jgi:outer membrane biosynthesis protein TonB
VQIACDQCQAQYEMDPPAAPFVRDQDLVFRCTACGNSILVKPGGQVPSATVAPSEPEQADSAAEETRSILLRQDGKTYHVKDQATLQRWIVERRILREDEISMGGQEWKKVGDFEGFHVFFELIDRADRGGEVSAETSNVGSAKVDLFAAPPTGVVPVSPVGSSEGLGRPIRLAVEAIPEEEPASLLPDNSPIGPDEPTMDMNFEEEDFFSEEHTVLDGDLSSASTTLVSGIDDDFGPEFEWAASRRKRVLVWWALCFSALGGTGWLALNYLNQRDAELDAVNVENVEAAEPEAPAEPVVSKTEGVDSGSSPEPAPEPAVEAEAVKEPPAEKAAAKTPTPKPTTKPEASPKKTTSKKTAKSKASKPERKRSSGNAKAETNRGWAYADRKDWTQARTHFNNAVKASPGHADARFGLAYVNEHQGRVEEAVRQYCRLQSTASGEAKMEASGRLRALGRECP